MIEVRAVTVRKRFFMYETHFEIRIEEGSCVGERACFMGALLSSNKSKLWEVFNSDYDTEEAAIDALDTIWLGIQTNWYLGDVD